MVRSGKKAVVLAAAVFCATRVVVVQKTRGFVPSHMRQRAAAAGAFSAPTMFAPAAFADEIGDADKNLGDASYAFAKEVDWNN
eukprot:3142962-Amphidinium_carterae.1